MRPSGPGGDRHPGAVAQQTQAGPFGQFFDEWGQPLGPGVVGPASGHVTVLVNGQVFKGNPRDVPLTAHAQIQLEVGTPLVAPVSISWASTGL